MSEKIFVNGMIAKTPFEGAPSWIISNISFKVEDMINFLEDNQKNGWVNIVLKTSKNGHQYAELNTYNKGIEMAIDEENNINLDDVI
jgi:hypothetical protein